MNSSPKVPWLPSLWVVGTVPRPHGTGFGYMSWSLVVLQAQLETLAWVQDLKGSLP
jgi:hypothetical protein